MLFRLFRICGSVAIVACVFLLVFSSTVVAREFIPGDLNLNGTPYELEDVGIFAEYFSIGLTAFTIDVDAQVAASDANEDGITLSIADYVYMLRIIWGEGDPPVDPADTFAVELNEVTIPGKTKLALTFADTAEIMLLQYDISGADVTGVILLPPYDEVFVEYDIQDNNMFIRLNGLSTIPVNTTWPPLLEISYTGTDPVLANVGGVGFENESLNILTLQSGQRGDVDLDGLPFFFFDRVKMIEHISGWHQFELDYEAQLFASEVDGDGIPATVADYQYLTAVYKNRIEPDYIVDPPLSGHFITSHKDSMFTITSTIDIPLGAILLQFAFSDFDWITPLPGADASDMELVPILRDDTLTLLINGSFDDYFIPAGKTQILNLEYHAGSLELISAAAAGYDGRTVDLMVLGRGDANGDGTINAGDAVTIINIIFKGFFPAGLWQEVAMDANCDDTFNVGDAVFIINYIFKGGPPPGCF